MAYSFKQRKDGGFDFFDATGKKTNIESYTKNTGANINQLRQKLATQGDAQSQRIVSGLPTQFRAPTQQSTPSVFNTPAVRTPTMPQTVSQPTIQAPKVYTPKAQQAYVDAKIIGTGRPNEVRQAVTRTVDRKNSVRLDPQFKQGKSYEDIARDGGFSTDEVKRYAERNHKGYGDQGVVGNAARATGQFIGSMFDRGAGIVTRPFNDISDLNRDKGEAELQQINRDYRSGNITPAAAMERANTLAGRYTTQKASLHDDGFIHIGVQSLPEFGGNFAQQGIDTASLLPVAGGAASGSARIASALGNKTAANTLNKAASIMTAGAQTQATSKLANALTARGINPQTANLVGNAITSNAKQSLVYGSAQTGADVASGRGITPESLAMNYGADFLMGAVPEIGLGSVGRGIDLNNAKVHQELVRTNPTYKANTDKLTGIDATIARAQANGDIRALEGLETVKAQLSDSNALIARRYAEQGFLGGKNATGFKDAEARGEVFTDTPDGLPRFEVSDENMKIKNPNGKTLGELIDHPELFKNYPQAATTKVVHDPTIEGNGFYNEKTDTIYLNSTASPEKALNSILHETQHQIQGVEGFARGTTPEAAGSFAKYKKTAGEAEADAVASRRTIPQSELYADGKSTLALPKDLTVKTSTDQANYITKGRTPSKIHPEDQTVMAKLIDYARGYGQKLSDNAAHELQIDAARIAERYGIEVKWTESRKPLSSLADAFDRRLSGQKYEGVAMSIEPTKFEQDLKKAGLGTEPDAYRKQPKDVKKAIDTYISNENPQLAYTLDSTIHFPDGIPKVRPEDVKRITGLTPREAGIPPIYVSKSASPMDKLAVEYETTVRGNTSGELKMTSEDFLNTMMDAIEANRSVGKQTKLIRELRNSPEVIAKAKATLDAERAQYGTPEVVEPSKSDVAFLKRTEKRRVEQDVTEHKAKMKAINEKIGEEKSRNPVLPTYKTKQVGIIDKAFRSTRSIIERQGESGKKLADALQEQRTVKELWIRQIETQIPTVMKLKGKEFENFIDATQGNAKPLNESVSKAITEWRSTHPEVRQRGLDAGLNIGDLGETYYPHFIDYDKIYKDKNTYNEAINHLVTTKQAATPEKAIELLSRARDISRNREFGNLEASRIIDLPFYDRSKNTLASYINSSADRITKAEVFGKSDEKALGLIKQIGLEGGDTEAAKNAFDVAVGAKQYNHTASKVSGGIRQYVTTTRLGLGALTNISQNVNTGVVTGHLRTMGAIFKQLDPKTRQWAADTGVISDAIIQDLRRGYGAETFGNKKLGRVVNAVTAPGFATVEKFNRRVAATAGKDYALRLAQNGDAKSISTLRKLGVEGDINGTLTDAQQVQAARKIVEKTQFKVDAQDLPGWTDSPGGKLVSQFRTFSYSQAKFFSNEVLKPAAKGNLMPLTRVLAALPLGYALYETRRIIDGRPEEEDKSKVALSSFQKIGGAGLALDIYLGMNPVGSKYLPSDRRVSMAVGTLGGPSAGIAADAVGSISEAVQRKNTPEDTSRLDGKIAVADNGEDYTDLTALSRFGLRQLPIVGTPIVNRAIPYKKQSDADAGKSTTGNAGLDELAAAKEKRSADLKASFSKEDWKLYNLSKADRQKLVSNGTYTQAKIDGLMKYGGAKESELGYGTTTTSVSAKTPTSAKSILETYNTLDTEARKKWNTEKNTDTAVTKGLQSWLGDKVKIPEVTNDVAKEWADFQNDYADGKVSKLKENDMKKAILKKAFNSQLNTDEKEIYNLSKTELQYYYDNGVITDENINKAIAVEKQLFEAGLIAKETLQRNLGSSARGYKTASSRSSGGRSTGTKTSKASIAEILASQKSINDINNSTYLSLSKLLGNVSSGSSKMAKNKIGREVTLKKISVKGAKA